MLNDRLGRRPLQALGFGGMAIAMAMFFIASSAIARIGIIIGIAAFVIDYGVIHGLLLLCTIQVFL